MKTLSLLLLLSLATYEVVGVDRNNFKTCEQSGFCKRLRGYQPGQLKHVLNLDTAIAEGHTFVAEVLYINEEKTILWNYALILSALVDGTFRVQLDEAKPIYPRYRTQLALNGSPTGDGLKIVSSNENKVIIKNTQGHQVVITVDPLKFEFLDKHGDVAMVLNGNSLLLVEPLQQKNEVRHDVEKGDGDGDGDVDGDVDGDLENKLPVDEPGMWSENFKSHHDSKPRGNEAVSLDVSFPDAEYMYGIPEHTDHFHLRNTKSEDPYRLYNLDVFEFELDSTMALYGAVPVVYAHGAKRSVGVFWHNSAETWVDVDTQSSGTVVSSIVNLVTGNTQENHNKGVRFMSESGIVDAFVMLGDKPGDVFRQYTRLTGVTPLPPKFSLAYHQCRWNYVDEADVRSLDENFDKHDIPADVYWLDIEYTDRKKYFTWDVTKFPHPQEMVSNVTAKGRKMVVIIDPHIKREPGYFLHEDATDNSYYVKNHQGKDYEGWCWPGSSSYLDFFNPIVTRYYSERYKYENFPGTTKDVHIWNDMNEPSVFNGPEVTMPKDCQHYKPNTDGETGIATFWEHRHVHNEYGLWHIRGTFEGLLNRDHHKYRPFILTRSTFAGTQRYAAVWTGDNTAEWGFLAVSIPQCLSLAASGITFCGSDVGGFFKYPEAELMTRWYQAGAFQPFFRAHSHIETKRREPWLYEAPTTALIRDAIRRRYALLDFWYTLFYEHTIDGTPVMRPMFQEFPAEKETYPIDNQYMLGSKLLVRPVVEEGVTSVKVYFPGRDTQTLWYDVDSYKVHRANGWISQDVTIAKIPVYQRGGTIIPRKERVRRSSALMVDDPYTLVIALDVNKTAHGTLYMDDSETYEYTRGKYIYAAIEYNKDALTYTITNLKPSYQTRAWIERIVIAGIKAAPKSAKLHQANEQHALQMTLHKGNDVLVVRKPGASVGSDWKIEFSY